jgi:leader peptidase (prepilin peptidase) / N-methyltransferase
MPPVVAHKAYPTSDETSTPLGVIDRNSLPPTRHTVFATIFTGTVVLAAMAASIVAAPGLSGILGAGLALLMAAIAIIDARHFIIPNYLNAAACGLALVNAGILAPDAVSEAVLFAILRGAVLALVFLGVREFYWRLRGREGLGLGDVKLAGVAGAWLDWLMIPVAIQIAAFAALTFFLLRSLVGGRPVRATGRLPFGLFLAPAIWICWLLEAMLLVRL